MNDPTGLISDSDSLLFFFEIFDTSLIDDDFNGGDLRETSFSGVEGREGNCSSELAGADPEGVGGRTLMTGRREGESISLDV